MITYEQRLNRNLDWALREGSVHFEKENAVRKTLCIGSGIDERPELNGLGNRTKGNAQLLDIGPTQTSQQVHNRALPVQRASQLGHD